MENITQGIYINEFGKLDNKAIPLDMTCEHKKCKNKKGNDYNRLELEKESGWENEPIFLCDEHRGNRQIFKDLVTI